MNGYEHTYNYEDRFNKNTGENKKIDEFNPENNEEKLKQMLELNLIKIWGKIIYKSNLPIRRKRNTR